MVATIFVVTRLTERTVHATFINLEGEDEPYVVGVTKQGPPFHVVGKPNIPDIIGQTEVTIHRHDDKEIETNET